MWYYNDKEVAVQGWTMPEPGYEMKLEKMNQQLIEDLGSVQECVIQLSSILSEYLRLDINEFSP